MMKTLNKREVQVDGRVDHRELTEQELLQATGGETTSSGVNCRGLNKDECEANPKCKYKRSNGYDGPSKCLDA